MSRDCGDALVVRSGVGTTPAYSGSPALGLPPTKRIVARSIFYDTILH